MPAKGKRRAEAPEAGSVAAEEAPAADPDVMQVDGVKGDHAGGEVGVSQPTAKRSKKSKKGPSRAGAAQEYENGVLRALVVENFMNHKHLRVDFDPHVNFIVGKNGMRGRSHSGPRHPCDTPPPWSPRPRPSMSSLSRVCCRRRAGSGKSAIVNALIAGFGHKASATGRNTNSAKSLIRNGCDEALIQVHIANGGEDAFNAHEFGDTIVAERRLVRGKGAGSYRLRDGLEGASRASTKKEFDEMCQHFNIQADNPCA